MLTDTVHALIRTSFVARLMAAVLGDIYPSIIPCWLINLILIGPPPSHVLNSNEHVLIDSLCSSFAARLMGEVYVAGDFYHSSSSSIKFHANKRQ